MFFRAKFTLFLVLSCACLSAQSLWDRDPHEVREELNQRILDTEAETPTVWSVTNTEVVREGRTTPIRIYRPNPQEGLPVLLLIHGGGWIAGNLDTHDNLARYLCQHAEVVVVSVEYVNAPEGKFPLGLEQCYDVLLWLSEQNSEIAVGGDSAGGNLSAALCLLARDRAGPDLQLQVLINPAPMNFTGEMLNVVRWIGVQYLADPKDAFNAYASPLLAKDLSRLPPAVVILAEKDEQRECGQQYADRLSEAGVPTRVFVQLGVGHLAWDGARASRVAVESLDVAVGALRDLVLSDVEVGFH